MMEMKEFQEKLGLLIGKAEEQGKNLNNEQILEIFGLNQLLAEQLQSLYEYLRIQGIRIQGIELKKMDINSRIREAEEKKQQDSGEIREKSGQECQTPEKPEAVILKHEDEACLKEYREYQKLLSPEEEGERESVLRAYAEGDSGALERLAQLYLPEILDMAMRLYRDGIFLGDLIQEGNLSLLTAPAAEMPEDSADEWMREQICRGMEMWLGEQAEQKLRDDSMVERVRKLEAAIREISDDDNQKFSIEELSAYLEMDEDEIRAILDLTGEGAEDSQNDA